MSDLPPNVVVDLVTAESGDVVSYTAFYPPIEVNAVDTPLVFYSTETIGSQGPSGATGPPGPVGPTGSPAFTNTTGNFTVPGSGATGTVTVVDASWVNVGQMVYLAGAGNLKVTAKAGNLLTLLNSGGAQ